MKFTTFKFAAVFAVAALFGYVTISDTIAAQAQAPAKKQSAASGASVVLDPTNPNSVLYLDTAGKPAGTGDATKPVSEAYKAGQAWHPQALQAAGLPKDRYGLINWAKLAKDNTIAPKGSIDPAIEEMPPLDMDVIIKAKGNFVNDVTYPHWIHTYWLKCEVCHPSIFVPAAGQNNMTMVGITNGEWCGRCHGKVAFPLTDCNRCHNVPKAGAKK